MRRFMTKAARPSEKQSQGAFKKRILIRVCALSVLFFVIGSMVLVNSAWAQTTSITINTGKTLTTNQFSLGFSMANEWRTWSSSSTEQQLARNGNFKMIHVYSWLVEPCTRWNEASETGTFNWASVDSLMQKIFAVGTQPIISLGYCDSSGIRIPSGMAINPTTHLPNANSFAAYCRAWVTHMQSKGFAVRYYEVINEAWYFFYPNWSAWSSVKAGYFLQLFNACYNAMHAQNSQVLVGNDASLHRKFLDYWIANGGKLDFLSFHNYDCDGTSMADQTPLQRAEQRFFITDNYFYGVNDARQLYFNKYGVTLPAIATEANWAATCSSGTDPRIQQVVGAVWTALMLKSSILNNVQYECYFSFSSSKSWEVSNKKSGGYGFGMVNQDNNQPWYPYYVQKLIGTNLAVGDQIVNSSSSSSDISTLAWVHSGKLNILLICKVTQAMNVKLSGVQGTLSYFKIDNAVSYQSPRVQTGTISASTTLTLNGYTVILLQN
jgi:hypothetical protein